MSNYAFTPRLVWSKSAAKQRTPKPSPESAKKPRANLAKAWAAVLKDYTKVNHMIRTECPSDVTYVDEHTSPRFEMGAAIVDFLTGASYPEVLDAEVQAALATAFGVDDYWKAPIRAKTIDALLLFWHLHSGVEFALDTMKQTLQWKRDTYGRNSPGGDGYIDVSWSLNWDDGTYERRDHLSSPPGAWAGVRRWLATLSEDEFATAKAHAARLCLDASLECRACFSYAFGDPVWVVDDLPTLATNKVHCSAGTMLAMTLASEHAEDYIKAIQNYTVFNTVVSHKNIPDIVESFGTAAPRVLNVLWETSKIEIPKKKYSHRGGAVEAAVAEGIAMIECEEAAFWLTNHLNSDACNKAVEDFASRAPQWIFKTLLEDPRGEEGDAFLQKILNQHPQHIEAWSQILSDKASARLKSLHNPPAENPEASPQSATTNSPGDPPLAQNSEVPGFLQKPLKTWKKKKKIPGFWSPASLPPLVLKTGARLSHDHMENLRQMMVNEDESNESKQTATLREICTPESLDAFGVALIDAWLASGGAGKDRWALIGARPLLNPAPDTQAEVDEAFFKDKTWYIYGRLKSYTRKQLQAMLRPRGARIVTSFSSTLDFIVQEGPGLSPQERQNCWARQYNAELLGEQQFIKPLLGRPLVLESAPAPTSTNEGLETLREALHTEEEDFRTTWGKIVRVFDDLSEDFLPTAIDYANAYINNLSDTEQRECRAWKSNIVAGDDHAKFKTLRSLHLERINGKGGERFLSCASLENLRWLTLINCSLPYKFWSQLGAASHLGNLEYLDMRGGKIDKKGAAALSTSAFARGLKSLNLGNLKPKPNALYDLLTAETWGSLESLIMYLSDRDLAEDPFVALRDASALKLKSLHIVLNALQDPSAWADFLSSPQASGLENLHFGSVNDEAALQAIANTPSLSSLKALSMFGSSGRGERLSLGFSEILRAEHMGNLESLKIRILHEDHLETLLSTDHLTKLQSLHVDQYFLDDLTDIDLTRLNFPALRHLEWQVGDSSSDDLVNLLLSDALPHLESVSFGDISDHGLQRLIDGLDRPNLKKVRCWSHSPLARKLEEKLGFSLG